VGDPQLLACVQASPLTSQPLAVEQVRAREVDAEARRPEMLDRLTVERLGRFRFGT
jgi:hypothetical protein